MYLVLILKKERGIPNLKSNATFTHTVILFFILFFLALYRTRWRTDIFTRFGRRCKQGCTIFNCCVTGHAHIAHVAKSLSPIINSPLSVLSLYVWTQHDKYSLWSKKPSVSSKPSFYQRLMKPNDLHSHTFSSKCGAFLKAIYIYIRWHDSKCVLKFTYIEQCSHTVRINK